MNKIYNEDCLSGGARYVLDNSIDLIICDLPYGNTHNKWDTKIDLGSLWSLFKRVLKPNGAVLLFGQRMFAAELIMSNKKWFRYDIVWKKPCPVGFLNASRMPLSSHELILVFYQKLPTYNPQFSKGKPYIKIPKSGSTWQTSSYGKYADIVRTNDGKRYPIDVVEFSRDKTIYHSTQKPVKLVEYLIKTYSNEGEIVLDCCMGSGTTAIACLNTGRRFIGFETNQEYYDICNRRIEQCLKEGYKNTGVEKQTHLG